MTASYRCHQRTKSGPFRLLTSSYGTYSDLHGTTPHPTRVRNLLALSKTQVNLADTDPLHSQPRPVAARYRSTQSLVANRRPSGCDVFRLPPLLLPFPPQRL